MILQIVAIRDRAVDAFHRPAFVPAIGAAIRSFGDEINRRAADNELNKHPEDYDLYHLGTYDDAHASFSILERPKQIAIGNQLVTGE